MGFLALLMEDSSFYSVPGFLGALGGLGG